MSKQFDKVIGCFFWAAILGARIIFSGDPYLNSTTVLFDYSQMCVVTPYPTMCIKWSL